MAVFDIKYNTQPQNAFSAPRGPKISDMRTALAAVNSGLSYTADRLNAMTENDMISACRIHNLTVGGL